MACLFEVGSAQHDGMTALGEPAFAWFVHSGHKILQSNKLQVHA